MINRDAKPIEAEHRPVYRRIEFGLVRRPFEAAEPVDLLTEAKRRTNAEYIWQAIRQTAEGCNAPTGAAEPVPVSVNITITINPPRSGYLAPEQDCA